MTRQDTRKIPTTKKIEEEEYNRHIMENQVRRKLGQGLDHADTRTMHLAVSIGYNYAPLPATV